MARVALAVALALVIGAAGLFGAAGAQVGPPPLPDVPLPDLNSPAPDAPTATPSLPLTPTQPPSEPEEEHYNRTVSLSLRKHLVARGAAKVVDEIFDMCIANVPLRIERRVSDGSWKLVKSLVTDEAGKYRTRIKDRTGRYRARVTEVSFQTQTVFVAVCLPARSAVARHRH